jgi:ABC-type transport system involved in multi-copper enzyme maturation permease subunit
MSSMPSSSSTPDITRSTSVVMGNQGFLTVLLRITGGELYKIRRRLMPKILLPIGIGVMIAAMSFILLTVFIVGAASTNTVCTSLPGGARNCHSVENPTPAEQQQIDQTSHQQVIAVSASLRLPGSLPGAVSIANFVGVALLVILIATAVGGEFSVGTVRLLLTRGPTRTQFFLAKVLTALICTLITLIVLTIIGIIVGALLNLGLGIETSWSFLNGEWLLRAGLYLLTATLGLFVYTTLALSLALLGRATAAGVAGAIIWWFLEGVIGTIIVATTAFATGPVADFVRAIPDYFIGNNISALLNHQAASLTGSSAATSAISDLHALLVLAGWLIIPLAIAWWVNERRDVTN